MVSCEYGGRYMFFKNNVSEWFVYVVLLML